MPCVGLSKKNSYVIQGQSLEHLSKAARWISMGIHPYANHFAVFIAGLKQDDEDSETHNMSEV
jgi:hypothetical protein